MDEEEKDLDATIEDSEPDVIPKIIEDDPLAEEHAEQSAMRDEEENEDLDDLALAEDEEDKYDDEDLI